jgi:hypothetical protein
MVDLEMLRRAAREVVDDQGNPVVQIPGELWRAFLVDHGQLAESDAVGEAQPNTPAARILAVMASWDEAEDESEAWWDEFDQFLRDNRLNFPYDESLFEGLDD